VLTSKVSEKDNQHDFYPKNFNHALLPKSDFEGYRKNAKKEFKENQNYIEEEFYQEPDDPSIFMKKLKERTQTMSAANHERCQVLFSKVICDGNIDCFELITMLKVIMETLVLDIYFIHSWRLI
jgi:hypothetical protein